MNRAVKKVKIERLQNPIEGHTVNAQIWINYGDRFCYCGQGKFFKTLQEALLFKAEMEVMA